jgi:hypothetical protein
MPAMLTIPDKPEFCRHPKDGLQLLADAQRAVPTIKWLDGDGSELSDRTASVMRDIFSATTPGDAVYWWPDKTAQLVSEKAADYPLPSRMTLPTNRHILFTFEKPVLFEPLTDCDSGNKVELAVSAVSYFGTDEAAIIQPWYWIGGRIYQGLTFGATTPNAFSESKLTFVRWLHAAMAFADDRVIGKQIVRVNRATRDRINGHVPDVNVVQLRTYDQSGRERGEPLKDIDFECRFWVRGHERRLPGTEDRIWIDTYLKGPDDKPIKERDAVLAVVR